MSFSRTLAARLLGEEPERAGPRDVALEQDLAGFWSECVAAWPELEGQAEVFAEHVAERLLSSGTDREALDGVAFADLGLAFLALQGEPRALKDLSKRAQRIAARVASRGAGPDLDELMFSLEGKLFDPIDSKLANFSGSGELDGWLSVLVTRTWLNLKRDRREVPQEAVAVHVEPESSLLGHGGGEERRPGSRAGLFEGTVQRTIPCGFYTGCCEPRARTTQRAACLLRARFEH